MCPFENPETQKQGARTVSIVTEILELVIPLCNNPNCILKESYDNEKSPNCR